MSMEKEIPSWREFFARLIYDIFFTSFFIYGVSFFLESFYAGIVVNYVNLKTVLIVCIISGLLSLLYPPQIFKKKRGRWDVICATMFSCAAGVYAYQVSPEAWQWRMVFSLAVGCAILSMLLALSHVYPEDVASSDGALPKS